MEVEVSDALIGVGQKSPFCNMLVLSPDGRTDGRTDRQTDTHTHTFLIENSFKVNNLGTVYGFMRGKMQ